MGVCLVCQRFHTGVFAAGGGGNFAEKQIFFWGEEYPPEILYKTTGLRLRVLAAYMYPVCDKFVFSPQHVDSSKSCVCVCECVCVSVFSLGLY